MSNDVFFAQMRKLQEVILRNFSENEATEKEASNDEFLKMFLDAKRIEGCSERTLQYYCTTVENLLLQITTSVRKITTEKITALM